MYPAFNDDIARMNSVYQLNTIAYNHAAFAKRLEQFKEILDKEFTELTDIQIGHDKPGEDQSVAVRRTVVDMADLLADIIVYCTSEARRWNIPLCTVVRHVMESNFSKLGEDGQPIKNPKTDKFEKGPHYWSPEPGIYRIMFGEDPEDKAAREVKQIEDGEVRREGALK